jgi:histidyl-tRNA synthetase
MAFKRNPKMLDQLQYCEKNQVELCVIIGDSELKAGIVKIRDVATREEVSLFLNIKNKNLLLFF